jgi:hypothetical protein
VSFGDWFPTFRMNIVTSFLKENQSQEEDKGTTDILKRRKPHSVKHQNKWIGNNIKYRKINIFLQSRGEVFSVNFKYFLPLNSILLCHGTVT